MTRFLLPIALALTLFTSPAAAGNLLFILDSSGSMWGKLEGQSKIQTAKSSLSKLTGDLPKDTKVGLMVYGHRYDRKAPNACQDIELLSPVGQGTPREVEGWLKRIVPKGKTPMAAALEQTADAFIGLENGNNNVVLISDGKETCDGDPCAVAGKLAKSNINVRVHVVGFDISQEDREQLECIAKLGKGKYFPADSTAGFNKAVSDAVKIAQTKEKPEPAPPAPEPKLYFFDDFEGETLSDHWQVVRPNPDAYIIEDGALLIVSGSAGALAKDTVPNLFKLSKDLPKGDWTATAKFNIDYQTAWERAFLALFDSADDYLEASADAAWQPYGNNRFFRINLEAIKMSKGEPKQFGKEVFKGELNEQISGATKRLDQPILLRISKKGRQYKAGLMLEGAKEPKWEELPELSILRQKGQIAFGLYQSAETKGESLATVDWVKIEVME